MRLKELVDTLEVMPPKAPVYVGGNPARSLASYRGYYNQLTITHGKEPVTAGELLKLARAAVGATFTGYKGGEYVMDEDTAVWGDDYGDAYGTALAGIRLVDGTVRIDTFDASDYGGF